jgi:two-component system, response regulator YesN
MYRMILAEDEELVRRAILATMDWEANGFSLVAAAKDGAEALSLVCTTRPDLVVTDLRMPAIDGISLIKMVKAELPDDECPLFIVLTAHGDFECARAALKLDVIDFLLKPLDDAELLSSLVKARTLLERKSRANRLESLAEMDSAFRNFASAKVPPPRDPQDAYVDRAAEEIKTRFVSDITVEEVALTLSISPGYLARVFKKRTGQTFYDYLTFTRMREAMELLRDPTIRIQDVADRVGYADQRNFSQRFRAVVGCTPSEFRQS